MIHIHFQAPKSPANTNPFEAFDSKGFVLFQKNPTVARMCFIQKVMIVPFLPIILHAFATVMCYNIMRNRIFSRR